MFINTVTVNIDFDYQGQHYELKDVIDIDHIIYHEDFYHCVYLSIAQSNNIDLHSYQLEIMMDQTIVFSNEKGCVQGCVSQGVLDLVLLKKAYQKVECLPVIERIIQQHIPKLECSDNITKALVDAYILGKNAS
ncbi:hypothetical protein HUE58_03465 [Candidatus Ruthia endofausta]|uniref:Uncharacterized protein n=1 Tax=Candidatus Ruthia endofausta TaxID=2738852 RepID=A0A6N0HPI1_9GAMM|nr:hypothetical protein [Candidatus Ruthia endofausta]QKQ24207.1 hypothetical protein HUE58_03465 [Candidatus Ruthia endofausta]